MNLLMFYSEDLNFRMNPQEKKKSKQNSLILAHARIGKYDYVIVVYIVAIIMPLSYCNGGGILFSSSPTNFQLW